MEKGKVLLVGAGPGAQDLITLKGIEAIRQADVLLYDRLINPMLLEHAPSHCEFVYCGKLPNHHTLIQENINRLLIEKALQGKTVVRLKGGDPGIFGRVGEEAEVLERNKIEFEIVPGVTSGIAAPLYAGIPVTHREYARSFAIVTAHDQSKGGEPLLDWESLAHGVDTLAFYMGVKNLPYICSNLLKHGKPAETPVILIQWGTLGRQKTLQGTLETIVEKAKKEHISNPAITLVGKVIKIREKINWFEKKPLYGRQILLSRTGKTDSSIAKELRQLGADVIEFPKMRTVRASLNNEMKHQLSQIETYDQIVFSSPESVDYFFEILQQVYIDIRKIRATLFGASVKSINALKNRGLIAKPIQEVNERGNRLIVGEEASIMRLEKEYSDSETFITHRSEMDIKFFPILERMLEEAQIDTIILPSGLSVQHFSDALKQIEVPFRKFIKGKQILCMGPKTKQAAESYEFSNIHMLQEATFQKLVEFLVAGSKSPMFG